MRLTNRILCFFFSVLLSSVPVSAQPVSKNSPASRRFKQLDSLANATWDSDTERARFYAWQAYSVSLQSGSLAKVIRAVYLRAFTNQTVYGDSSYMLLKKALTLAKRYHVEGETAEILYTLSSLYMSAGELKTALNCLDSAMVVARRQNQVTVMAKIYNTLGNIYLESYDSLGSMQMYREAYYLSAKIQDFTIMGTAEGNMAQFLHNPREQKEALKSAINTLQKAKESEDEIAQLYINLGLAEANPGMAIKQYYKALNISRNEGLPVTQIGALNNMAYSFLEINQPDSSMACIKQAITLAYFIDNHNWLATVYDTYADILIHMSKPGEAVAAMKRVRKEQALDDNRKSLIQVRLLSAMMDTRDKEEALIKSSK